MTRQEEIVLARMVNMRNTLDGFETAALKSLEATYAKLTEELLDQVKLAQGKTARLWTNTRLISLLEETQLMHSAILAEISGQTTEAVVASGAYSYDQMNNITSWDGQVSGFNSISLTANQMKQLVTEQTLGGKVLADWIGSALLPDIDNIKSEIAAGYIRGEGYAKIVSRLENALLISKGSQKARDLETIVKTYIQSMNVKAQQDVYEANKEVVKQVEWTAIMENGSTKTGRGTCPRCIALDGQRWGTTDYSRPSCPLHARCRCMLIPVTKTWKDLGFDVEEMEDAYQPWTIRGAKGSILDYGHTDMSYGQWWHTRDKAFQDNAVGVRRADLIREGKLAIPDMVDSKGDLIPLKSLNTNN